MRTSRNLRCTRITRHASQILKPEEEAETKAGRRGGAITASLGAMRPLVEKLDKLLQQGCSPNKVEEEMKALKENVEKLSYFLEDLSEVEDPTPTAKCWMNEARDLSYKIEDYIDSLLVLPPADPSLVPHNSKTTRPFHKWFSHAKTPEGEKQIAATLSEFRSYAEEAIEGRRVRVGSVTLRHRFVSLGPMLPTPYDIVIDGRMNEFINSFDKIGDENLHVVSVLGSACLGKTTLARALYNKLGRQYHYRAFIRVSRKPNMKRIFRDMLSQLQVYYPSKYRDGLEMLSILGEDPPEYQNELDLINYVKEYLRNKRYLIIICDVCAASVWDIINQALPEGSHGSRIITTTQIEDVALACCRYRSELVFEMKPMDDYHSRNLFFNRIFGSESYCPEEFNEVLNKIVEICGGLPLATISIASLLASQPVMTEDLLKHIHESLSSCFSASSTSERTRQALNLSFNHLPDYLKTCLLYLRIYPQGNIFWRHDLMKQWMAESFIDISEGQDMEKVAGSYLDELVSRRFIQPICVNYNNEVLSFAVHNTVHDLIAHKSAEQNFIVAIDDSPANVLLSHKARRLSLLFCDARYAKIPENVEKSQVRSLTYSGFFESKPSIKEFTLLRILNLQLSGHDRNHDPVDLSGISELFQLRYFKIASDVCIKLPKHGLQCLETLDISDARVDMDSGVPCVPYIHLPHLLHLSLSDEINLVKWINTLMSDGKLKYLQDLHITILSTSASNDLELNMGSLMFIISSGHHKLKTIVVRAESSVRNVVIRGNGELSNVWNDVILPPLIQRFEFVTHSHFVFSRIPLLAEKHVNLCILKIEVRNLETKCVDILRGLPALTALSLYVHMAPYQSIMFDKAGFSVLKYFKLRFTSGIARLKFKADAMPNLWKLKLVFNAIPQMDQKLIPYSNDPLFEHQKHGSAVISIEHMPGLKEITVKFGGAAADVEYALRFGVTNHRSNPTINMQPVDYSCYRDQRSGVKQGDEIPVEERDICDKKQPDEYFKQQSDAIREEEPDEYNKQQPEDNFHEEPEPNEIPVEEQDAYFEKQQDDYFNEQTEDNFDEEPDEYYKQQPENNLYEKPDDFPVEEAASVSRIEAAYLFATQTETQQPAACEDDAGHVIDIEFTSLDNKPPPAHRTLQELEMLELSFSNHVEMLDLSKYILLLAGLVATATYATAFSPPGGVWKDTDDATGRVAGDSIIRTTSSRRYRAFYYCNATAFASSFVVIIMVLLLSLRKGGRSRILSVKGLQAAMVLDLVSLMGAYAAGTSRDTVTTAYSCTLVGLVLAYLVLQTVVSFQAGKQSNSRDGATVGKRLRKVLMLLATFAISVTYVAGMTTPGGFWDAGSGHPPGHAILGDGHGKRLTVFLCFNASAFFASLLIIVVLLDKRPHVNLAYGCITVALVSLVVGYASGSCRKTDTTIYVISLN